MIFSDDHSAPYAGCYGDPVLKTPNLDQFAKDGILFKHAYTAAPQCVPSRAAFLTGRSPVACRMGRFSSPLPPDVAALPELLRPKRYYTGICGRYFHLDGVIKPNPVTERVYAEHDLRTFDRRADWINRGSPDARQPQNLNEFLDRVPAGRPFFLWMNFSDPHHVWNSTEDIYDPARIPVPAHLPDLPGIREDLAKYYGEVTRFDRHFGQVMQALKDRKQEENTLVLFAGDNGMAFPHGKGSLYDPGLHVPMIARWPARIRPGAVSNDLISGEDVTPTLLDAAGAEALPVMTGRSFLGLMTGGAHTPRKYISGARLPHGNSPYAPRSSTYDLSRCVRSSRYKLIYNCTPQQEYSPVDSARDPGWQQMVAANRDGSLKPEFRRAYFTSPRPVFELYDLEQDPAEMNNVAESPAYAAVREELTAAMQEKMIVDYDFLPLPMQG